MLTPFFYPPNTPTLGGLHYFLAPYPPHRAIIEIERHFRSQRALLTCSLALPRQVYFPSPSLNLLLARIDLAVTTANNYYYFNACRREQRTYARYYRAVSQQHGRRQSNVKCPQEKGDISSSLGAIPVPICSRKVRSKTVRLQLPLADPALLGRTPW